MVTVAMTQVRAQMMDRRAVVNMRTRHSQMRPEAAAAPCACRVRVPVCGEIMKSLLYRCYVSIAPAVIVLSRNAAISLAYVFL